MREQEFQRIARLVHERAGIALGPAKQSMAEARLSKRLSAVEDSNFGTYVKRVQRDPQEFQMMLEALTTHRTHFFREAAHFEHLLHVLR